MVPCPAAEAAAGPLAGPSARAPSEWLPHISPGAHELPEAVATGETAASHGAPRPAPKGLGRTRKSSCLQGSTATASKPLGRKAPSRELEPQVEAKSPPSHGRCQQASRCVRGGVRARTRDRKPWAEVYSSGPLDRSECIWCGAREAGDGAAASLESGGRAETFFDRAALTCRG